MYCSISFPNPASWHISFNVKELISLSVSSTVSNHCLSPSLFSNQDTANKHFLRSPGGGRCSQSCFSNIFISCQVVLPSSDIETTDSRRSLSKKSESQRHWINPEWPFPHQIVTTFFIYLITFFKKSLRSAFKSSLLRARDIVAFINQSLSPVSYLSPCIFNQ